MGAEKRMVTRAAFWDMNDGIQQGWPIIRTTSNNAFLWRSAGSAVQKTKPNKYIIDERLGSIDLWLPCFEMSTLHRSTPPVSNTIWATACQMLASFGFKECCCQCYAAMRGSGVVRYASSGQCGGQFELQAFQCALVCRPCPTQNLQGFATIEITK